MARTAKYVTDAQTFNKEFQRVVDLRTELSKRLSEVQDLIGLLEKNTSLPEEVETNLQELKDEADTLSTVLANAKSYADSIETYYDSWSTTKKKIDDEHAEAVQQNSELQQYAQQAEELEKKLTAELNRSTNLLDDARNTLEIVTNSSLSSDFMKRSDDRKMARRWWTVAVAVATVLFASSVLFAVLVVAHEVKDQSSLSVWVLKLAIVAPFAYVLYFVTRQYTHERDLEEKYAFKALISQTIQNNTKLLSDEFLDEDELDPVIRSKIVDFVVDSLQRVYREPFSTAKHESRIRFKPKDSSIEAESTQSESN